MMEYLTIGILVLIIVLVNRWRRLRQTIDSYKDKYIFITGCDSGFGFMLTKKLDSLGFHVFPGCLTERGYDVLKRETSTNVNPVRLDVTKQSSIDEAFKYVKSQLPAGKGLWGLVNNAGIAGAVAPVDWLHRKDYDECLAINLFGMIDVTKTFLPLIKKYRGRIVNITSMMGRIAAAGVPYVVSKFGAEGYSDCLRRNLYKTGVTVHILEPGFFATNIAKPEGIIASFREHYEELDQEDKDYYGQEYVDKSVEGIEKSLEKIPSPKTEKVINAYVHALTAKYPKARYVVGLDANTVFRFLWTVPEWLSDFILTFPAPKPKGAL